MTIILEKSHNEGFIMTLS